MEVPRPRTVWIPAYVCVKVGHGLDSRECFSWQAPAGVGVGGRGPRQGHVRLSRQRPADWVVTELGVFTAVPRTR